MFIVNNRAWHIVYVKPNSKYLRTSNGIYVLGVTDNKESCIFVNRNLKGRMLEKVISHELCHVFCFSYGIILDLEQEELIADFLATYGRDVFKVVDSLMDTIYENIV